jgi:tellurite methyltransferase
MNTRTNWNERHAARETPTEPAAFVADRAHLLPPGGRALDVAGGTGRHAVWLARRGFEVTLVDVSDVGLARATSAADDAGVMIATVQVDLAAEAESLPPGPFDAIVVHHYLDRDVWSALPDALAPGGVLLVCQPTVRNLERHPRPSARWLLDEGEIGLLTQVAVDADPDLEVVEITEDWTDEGRHEARLVLRRAR